VWLKGKHLTLSKDRIEAILLIQLGDIGDVVLSLPCIRALKENFPKAAVAVAVLAKAKEIIDIFPWADDVIAIEKDDRSPMAAIQYQFDFFKKLRKHQFDLAIDLRASTRGAVLARLSGAAIRVSYYSTKETFWRSWVFTHLKPFMPDPNLHQSLYYQNLLAECGIHVSHRQPEINVPDASTQKANRLLARFKIDTDKQLIAVHPFALWRYKEWPIEKTADLVHHLTCGTDRTALIIGASSELKRAQTIVNRCGGRAINLAGETDLNVLAAILKQCLLAIGMDSAVGHISAAVGTPCVTIFGPGKAGVWAPIGNHNRMVHKELPCIFCGQKGCNGTGRSLCLEELSVEAVLTAVEAHINTISSPNRENIKKRSASLENRAARINSQTET